MKKSIALTAFLFVVAVGTAVGQTTADEWANKGNEYFDKKDYTNAINAFSEAIKRDNNNYDLYWGRGESYHNIGNYNAAITDYNKAISLNPNEAGIYDDRAKSYLQVKNYNAAIADCNKAIALDPQSFYYVTRGNAYFLIKNYDAALTDYNKAISLYSDDSYAYIGRGDTYGAKGLYHKAIADYKTGFGKGYEPNNYVVDKTNKSDMWFCGAMYMEIIVNRFLGKNDVVTKYENWLKTVCDKNKVTRAEVEAFYRDNIRALISSAYDEGVKNYTDKPNESIIENTISDFKKIILDFYVNPNQTTFNNLKYYMVNTMNHMKKVQEEYSDDMQASLLGAIMMDKVVQLYYEIAKQLPDIERLVLKP